jgi:hypothetical protein
MPRKAASEGKITTFFSYKGGVGRTMAVANVGFIAALAGKRVLLMDWDLEAPGLAVYFRGIMDHRAAGDIRRAKGILDLFIEWRDAMVEAKSASKVADTARRFRSGKPFEACACPLLPAARLPKGARLDIISAGAALIGEREPLPYPEALSHFQWSSFFSDYAGGALVDALRRWCKSKYDYILVDSRTGLADVAGICTMQLPDEVVLCFVLNRQNTEGVADIARSIRASRGDEVAIRLSPMRVSKERPTEEADARARAQREMRSAGLAPEVIESDMIKLAIAAAPNIPFYETLAPFAATSPTADPLTFEYLRMTQELVGSPVATPRLDPDWIEEVRRRLQPRMTTTDYLATLESADPDRAIEELDRFLDGALDADPDRELEPDYVKALVTAAFEIHDWFWDDTHEPQMRALSQKALLLLQQLHKIGEGDWRLPLVEALDEFDGRWSFPQGLKLLERNAERDEILADGNQSGEIISRRAALRIQNARMLAQHGSAVPRIERELFQAEALMNAAAGPLEAEMADTIMRTHAEIAALRAERLTRRQPEEARKQWLRVLELLANLTDGRARVLRGYAHLGLAGLVRDDPEAAADHVIEAVRSSPYLMRDLDRLTDAVNILFSASDTSKRAIVFTSLAFGRVRDARIIPPRPLKHLDDHVRFTKALDRLVCAIGSGTGNRTREALTAAASAADQQLHRLARTAGRAGAEDPAQL